MVHCRSRPWPRVGDSPIIGAGAYCERGVGGAAAGGVSCLVSSKEVSRGFSEIAGGILGALGCNHRQEATISSMACICQIWRIPGHRLQSSDVHDAVACPELFHKLPGKPWGVATGDGDQMMRLVPGKAPSTAMDHAGDAMAGVWSRRSRWVRVARDRLYNTQDL